MADTATLHDIGGGRHVRLGRHVHHDPRSRQFPAATAPITGKPVNSWGNGWGAGGEFYVSDADFAKLLAGQGDITVLVR